MSLAGLDRQVCGCLGCHSDAVAIVRHPRHGRRIVCESHGTDLEVIERV